MAYWPLDFDGTSVDFGNRVQTDAWITERVGVTGSAEMALLRVPNGDTSADCVGDPRANKGSVFLSGAACRLVVPFLGLRADMAKAFTFEGVAEVGRYRVVVRPRHRHGNVPARLRKGLEALHRLDGRAP